MAKPRITQRLKVYQTRIGIRDWIVAVPSQKAALAAWDVRENLFASGAAREINTADAVELAMKTPGVPVPAPHNGKIEVPDSPAPKPQRKGESTKAKAKPVKKGEHGKSATVISFEERKAARAPAREEKPKPPDRSRLDAAEKELEQFDKETGKTRSDFEKRKRALEGEIDDFETTAALERRRLFKRVERERDSFENS